MKISYRSLLDCSNDIAAITTRIEAILLGLEEIDQSLKSHLFWEGPASEYYSRQFSEITSSFDLVVSGVRESGTYLKQVVEAHQNLEEQIASNLLHRNYVE